MLGPPAPDRDSAVFLDFDGSLVDIAERPDGVHVHPDLIPTLMALEQALDGAVALVSGRALCVLDAFLQPLRLSAAGSHGAERRSPDGRLSNIEFANIDALADRLQAALLQYPDLLLERKPTALAVHFRQRPDLESWCLATMSALIEGRDDLSLLQGKCVLELKPARASKDGAVLAFLSEPPFIGRTPFFIGDDITDEPAFVAVQAYGGHGIKVGDGWSHARHRLAQPRDVRAWLKRASLQISRPE